MANSDYVNPPQFLPTLLTSVSLGSVEPLLSSRMAGFATGSPQPLKAHSDWLRGAVADKIRSTPGCWVALYGHASLVGNAGYNLQLSSRRIDAVEAILKDALKGRSFDSYRPVPRGISDSFVDPTGNDPAFRSVEVFVYPPTAPRPKETLEECLAFKKTVFVKTTSTQWDPPDPGDKWGKFGRSFGDWFISKFVTNKSAVTPLLARHAYEKDMPDFGDVRERRMFKLGKNDAMYAIDIETKVVEERSVGIMATNVKVTITNEYRYHYGEGARDRKVHVRRKVTTQDRSPEALPTFWIDQPTNYQDP